MRATRLFAKQTASQPETESHQRVLAIAGRPVHVKFVIALASMGANGSIACLCVARHCQALHFLLVNFSVISLSCSITL